MTYVASLTLKESLQSVVQHIASWNRSGQLGLQLHNGPNGLIGWHAGNGLIIAYGIAGTSTHIELHATLDLASYGGGSLLNEDACKAWNGLGKHFEAQGWLDSCFVPQQKYRPLLRTVFSIIHYSPIENEEELFAAYCKTKEPAEPYERVHQDWQTYHDLERWADKVTYEILERREKKTLIWPEAAEVKTLKHGAVKNIQSKREWLDKQALQLFTELSGKTAQQVFPQSGQNQVGETSTKETLHLILQELRQQSLEQGEMRRTLDAIRRALRHSLGADLATNEYTKQSLESALQKLDSHNSTISQKLEFVIPLIPFLTYKAEVDLLQTLQSVLDFIEKQKDTSFQKD